MCNLYSHTSNVEAIRALVGAFRNLAGNLAPQTGIFPDYPAPIVRTGADGERELAMARWGMPSPPQFGGAPVTNIRNVASPHWRRWTGPASRCLVPFTSFSEYAPEPNPVTKRKDVVWFALSEERPLAFFAGLWTRWDGMRGTKANPVARPARPLRLPHLRAERRGEADPPEGHARHPHHGRGARGVDACTVERGLRAAAALAG